MQYYKNSMCGVIKSDSVFRTKGSTEIETGDFLEPEERL